jgi:hypothetical protein
MHDHVPISKLPKVHKIDLCQSCIAFKGCEDAHDGSFFVPMPRAQPRLGIVPMYGRSRSRCRFIGPVLLGPLRKP